MVVSSSLEELGEGISIFLAIGNEVNQNPERKLVKTIKIVFISLFIFIPSLHQYHSQKYPILIFLYLINDTLTRIHMTLLAPV